MSAIIIIVNIEHVGVKTFRFEWLTVNEICKQVSFNSRINIRLLTNIIVCLPTFSSGYVRVIFLFVADFNKFWINNNKIIAINHCNSIETYRFAIFVFI